ncbi:MAG: serine/threonine-protein kinase [Gemmataceae bacterium]
MTELLLQWETLRSQGRTIALEDLCADTPDLVDELRRRIQAREGLPPVPVLTSGPAGKTATLGPRTETQPEWPVIPGYEVLGALGHGGMGVVYKVKNRAIDRIEALKMIQPRAVLNPEAAERFQLEIRAMAQFEHPRIVRIYAAGQHAGNPYFTMEYVAGGALTRQLGRLATSPEAAVALTVKIAQAVHYLHGKNVVHRDLKPGNVLLKADLDEPLVSDFGLVKLFDRHADQPGGGDSSDTQLTSAGAVVGTASYMSPEQAAGETANVTGAADVWSIGVMLYEMLAGQRPFQGKDPDAVRLAVRTQEPPLLRRVRPKLDCHLEAICLRCLEKQPAARYSAQALADDLQRWQRGEAILPERWPRRLWRQARRHPAACAALALLLVFSVVLAVTFLAGSGVTETRDWTAEANKKLQALPAELATQERLTLIPAAGPAPGYRWVTPRGPHDSISHEAEKPFSVHADGFGLVELLPPHALTRYRLRLEVHHEGGDQDGAVGVYLGYSKQAAADGMPVHCFCGLYFNDIAVIPGRPPEQSNDVALSLHLLYWKAPDKFVLRLHPAGVGVGASFQSAGQSKVESWRKLELEVEPEEIRITWDGKPLRTASRAAMRTGAAFLVAKSPVQPLVQPQFLPQEGLGLLVKRGSAWFRSCSIEAMPK